VNSSDRLAARQIGGYTPSIIEENWTALLHRGLIRMLRLAEKNIPRFSIDHLNVEFYVSALGHVWLPLLRADVSCPPGYRLKSPDERAAAGGRMPAAARRGSTLGGRGALSAGPCITFGRWEDRLGM